MQFSEIRDLIHDDILASDALIRKNLHSEVEIIQNISEYVFQSGGKRLRLILTLLSGKICTLEPYKPQLLGAIIEMIHTATLLHDDVIDESKMRRGQASANSLYGNAASVLSGDFLYSRTFEMMVELGDLKVLQELAQTSNKIAEGEMMQLQNCHQPNLSEQDYLQVIGSKTAALFEAATKIPAAMAQMPTPIYEALKTFGNEMGTAFQILDDVIDYTSNAAEMGKNPGDDLSEGKMTLPLIYARHNANPNDRNTIDTAILNGDTSALPAIIRIIEETHSLEKVRLCAEQFVKRAKAALAILPQSPYRKALESLADLAIERSA
jgi:octaprenyl-diphosphate synthase